MSNTPQEPTGSHPRENAAPVYTAMPGWVTWFVIAAVVLGVVVLVALLVGGEHGPGRHMSQGTGSGTVIASAALR